MKLSILGASGKTGTHLVRESHGRGYRVVAVCRDSSREKLDEFTASDGFTLMTAPAVSDEATLTRALAGCDAAVAVLIGQQPGWTIVRAPSLCDRPPSGYRLCRISDVTSAHTLSRADYAACLLDSLGDPQHHRRTLAVVPAGRRRMGT